MENVPSLECLDQFLLVGWRVEIVEQVCVLSRTCLTSMQATAIR